MAAKWYLQDEEFAERALLLRAEFDARRAVLMAPDHVRYETANALRNAVRARRITAAVGDSSITDFLASGITFVDGGPFLSNAYRLSLRLNTSLYDALYLTLAEFYGGFVISDDRKFRRALGGSHPRVVWLEDYQPGV